MEPGQTLAKGRFTLTQQLGTGQRYDVWQAIDDKAGIDVAIKILSGKNAGQRKIRDAFLEGTRAAQAVRHANLIEVYDVLTEGGVPYLVMELVSFGSLADFTKIEGVLPPAWASQIMQDLLRGVQAAHEQGLIHGDIKPGNILLTEDGVPKLADLGITQVLASRSPYRAPEYPRADPRADMFGCALTLYNLVTGQPPDDLKGTSRNDALKVLPGALARVIKNGSSNSPDDRPQSATEFRLALEDVHGSLSEDALELAPEPPAAESNESSVDLMVFDGGPPPMDADDPSFDAFDEEEDEETEDSDIDFFGTAEGKTKEEEEAAEGPLARLEALGIPLWFVGIVGVSFLAVCGGVFMFMLTSLFGGPPPLPPETAAVELPVDAEPERTTVKEAPQSVPAIPAKKTYGSSQRKRRSSVGTLVVSAMPTSEVSIDGRRKGWDNWRGSISSGTHTIKLRHGDGRTKSARVKVSAGKTTRYCWNFREGVECH